MSESSPFHTAPRGLVANARWVARECDQEPVVMMSLLIQMAQRIEELEAKQ